MLALLLLKPLLPKLLLSLMDVDCDDETEDGPRSAACRS